MIHRNCCAAAHLTVAPHPVAGFRSSFSIQITPLASPVCLPAFHLLDQNCFHPPGPPWKIPPPPVSLHLQPSKLSAIYLYWMTDNTFLILLKLQLLKKLPADILLLLQSHRTPFPVSVSLPRFWILPHQGPCLGVLCSVLL